MPQQTSTTSPAATQLRNLPLSRLTIADAFNPRQQIARDQAFDALVATIRERGVLQSIRVRATTTGDYVVIAGHRRYLAAIEARVMEVPCLILEAGAGDAAEEAELRIDALIENDVRADLDPVDRAVTYRHLLSAGLTVKGIAQRTQTTQARIKEHLQILELPDGLRPLIAERRIPLLAVKPLARLARIHEGLAPLAVQRLNASTEEFGEPLTWAELGADPIAVCCSCHDHHGASCRPASTTPHATSRWTRLSSTRRRSRRSPRWRRSASA